MYRVSRITHSNTDQTSEQVIWQGANLSNLESLYPRLEGYDELTSTKSITHLFEKLGDDGQWHECDDPRLREPLSYDNIPNRYGAICVRLQERDYLPEFEDSELEGYQDPAEDRPDFDWADNVITEMDSRGR